MIMPHNYTDLGCCTLKGKPFVQYNNISYAIEAESLLVIYRLRSQTSDAPTLQYILQTHYNLRRISDIGRDNCNL